MQTITKAEVYGVVSEAKGGMMTVTFKRKTDKKVGGVVVARAGDLRTMTCRTGVKKHLTGVGAKYSFAEKKLLSVYSIADKGYRSIPVDGVVAVKASGEEYEVA